MESPQKPAHPFPAGGRTRHLALVAAIVAGLCTVSQASASTPEYLDTSFGVDGQKKFLGPMIESTTTVSDIAIDETERILSAVHVNVTMGRPQMVISRHLDNGTIDGSFGANGYTIPITGVVARAIALQNIDGKILMAGLASENSDAKLVLVRYTSAGILDTSFGVAGKVFLSAPEEKYWWSRLQMRLLVQSNGRIVVVAQAGEASSNLDSIELRRFDVNGAPDSTFGVGGISSVNLLAGYDNELGNLILTGNDQFVGVGASHTRWGRVFRLTSNGVIDTGFGTSGILKIEPIQDMYSRVTTVAELPDGKYVVGGVRSESALAGADWHFFSARITSTGVLDNSTGADGDSMYGIAGYAVTSMVSYGESFDAMFMEEGRKIVLARSPSFEVNQNIELIRLLVDGRIDPTFEGIGPFDGPGEMTVPINDGDIDHGIAATSMVRTATGKILLSGSKTSLVGKLYGLLTQIKQDGSLDTGFNVTGEVLLKLDNNELQFSLIHLAGLPDGSAIGIGSIDDPTNRSKLPALIRLLPNGEPDLSFGFGFGLQIFVGFPVAGIHFGQVVATRDGFIALVTVALGNGNPVSMLMKLHRDGTPVESFEDENSSGGLILLGGLDAIPTKVMVAPNNDILIIGSEEIQSEGASIPFILRLNSDGSRDTALGSTGMQYFISLRGIQIADAVLVGSDDVVFVGDMDGSLAVLGKLTFGSAGFAVSVGSTVPRAAGMNEMYFMRIANLASGKFVVAGMAFGNSGPARLLAKFNANLTQDFSLQDGAGVTNGIAYYPTLLRFEPADILTNDESFSVLWRSHSEFDDGSSISAYGANGEPVANFGNSEELGLVLPSNLDAVSLEQGASGGWLAAGNYDDPERGQIGFALKIDGAYLNPPPPVVSPPSESVQETVIATTLPVAAVETTSTSTSTSTTVPTSVSVTNPILTNPVQGVVVKKRVQPKLTRKTSVTAASVAKYIGLRVPKGAKLVMKSQTATQKVCAMRTARLWGLKPGTCRVNLTMTAKGKKPVKKVVKLLVTK